MSEAVRKAGFFFYAKGEKKRFFFVFTDNNNYIYCVKPETE